MRYGVCIVGDLEKIKILSKYNYDYFEANFAILTEMEADRFNAFEREAQRYGIKGETYNSFFNPDIKLYGADYDFIKNYVTKGMQRAHALGGEIAVIGSGGARNIPNGYPYEKAENEFIEALKISAEIADKYSIKLAIEPLNHNETNYINTVSDGISVCKKANIHNVGTLIDFYHCYLENDKMEILDSKFIIHTHIARPNPDRGAPTVQDFEASKKWAHKLKELGYNERISAECIHKEDFDAEIRETKEFFKLFEKEVK